MWLSVLMQFCGGFFFLLNKLFFSISERQASISEYAKLVWRVRSWTVYIVGLPFWVVIFIWERDWIAAALETGCVPIMLLGLFNAVYKIKEIKQGKDAKDLSWMKPAKVVLNIVSIVAIILGVGYSFHDFGNLTRLTQWLEIGTVIGVLFGTYLLAYDWPSGYLWYLLMHGSMGWLMYQQHYYWLAGQQLASFIFVADAYAQWQKHNTCSECSLRFTESNPRSTEGVCQDCSLLESL